MTDPEPGVETRVHLVGANRSVIYLMLCRSASGGHPFTDAVLVSPTRMTRLARMGQAATARAGLNINDEPNRGRDRVESPTQQVLPS
jgi:hypothetical protein